VSKSLVICRVFPPEVGGSGRWFWEIYSRQPAAEVCVAAGLHPASAEFDKNCPFEIDRLPLDVPSWGLVPSGFGAYAGNFARLLAIARRRRARALHAGTILPEGFLAWLVQRRTGLPYLCYVHGEEIPVVAGSRELSWMARRVLRGAHTIVANSENTRRMVVERWSDVREKVVVVTPGVDAARFRPAPPSAAVREKLGWGGRTVVLTAGRLQERKGHDMLIRALPAVRRAVPDVLYAIVGDGDRRPALESLAAELNVQDCVRFYGEMGDDGLIECYQQCDLFALPNREVNGDFEGFGMVLVEAQACGRAVLAGASGGTAETLSPGETGRLVNCDRPETVAETLMAMLADRDNLERMGEAARRWAVERFDWPFLATRAASVFAGLHAASGINNAVATEEGASYAGAPCAGGCPARS
jgi:phosphatidylinositol alpha-1,6-mannosyltransferase